MKKAWWMIVPALVVGVLACAPGLRVAERPFVLAEMPMDYPRYPLRLAVVDGPAMAAYPTDIGEKFNFPAKLADATLHGLTEAARLVVLDSTLVTTAIPGEFDLVCTPANPFIEFRKDRMSLYVSLTLEVTVREPNGTERGLLLSGEGEPGKRPVVPIHALLLDGRRIQAGVTGALTDGGRFEQAVDNALFYLSFDFADKLRRRLESSAS